MGYFIYFLLFLLGASIGSFINVVIDRLPRGQSLINPGSHCPYCSKRLGVWELVPVASYLWLRGRCRHCSSPIPIRYLVVEALSGALLLALFLYYDGHPLLGGITALYIFILLTITFIDLENGLIPNKIIYPALPVCLGLSFLYLPLKEGVWLGVAGSPYIAAGISALLGGGLGFLLFGAIAYLWPGGMGWGDVKLSALIGFMTGFPLVLVALFLSVVLGGVWAIGLLILRKKGRKEAIPFAPFLCLGGASTLLWGSSILGWYTRLLTF